MHKIKYFGILLALSFTVSSQTIPEFGIEIKKVSDHIKNFGSVGVSVTAVLTSESIILFDTHRSPGIMKNIEEKIIRESGSKNFKYVINTHGHWDHIGGNELFRNTEIIAHENAAKCISISPPNAPGSPVSEAVGH